MEFKHISVLKGESIEGLNIKPDGIYIDCTTGGGGHSLEIVKKLTSGKLICFDKDTDALKSAKLRLKDHLDKIIFINENFAELDTVLEDLEIDFADGILADLGVSSYQIDTAERGFSFMHDGPLDMRMNKNASLTAEYIINNYSETKLTKIMFMYGEEKNAKQIARKIIKSRENKPLTTTFELRDIILSSYPPKFQGKVSICNKVFQAFRIEVNNELNDLPVSIEKMLSKLKKDGRLCIITFHPLEDRIVKQSFKLHSTECVCPPRMPLCVCKHKADIKLITRHPIIPKDEELSANIRSASSKLRIAEKL